MSVPEDFSTPELPRSVLLALWMNAASIDPDLDLIDVIAAVEDDDEPHRLAGDGVDPGPSSLTAHTGLLRTTLAAWLQQAIRSAALLPVPGDASGLPGTISAAATTAGECLLLRIDDQDLVLVPEIETFGSVWEQGFHVAWTAHRTAPWENKFVGAVGTIREAERGLRRALLTATEALAGLDVARWRPDAADAIHALGSGDPIQWDLPPAVTQRQVQVLTLAARLRTIVDLATADDGGAVNLWQADQRATALREVDYAARHALAAATLPLPEE